MCFSKAPLWLRAGARVYRDPKLRRGLDGTDQSTPGHITDLLTDAGIEYIRAGKQQPFLLWMAYNAPHVPWYADTRYRQRYEGKDQRAIAPPNHPKKSKDFDWIGYYSVITHLDEAIGRLIAELERAGLWENTVIFFLGDNGYMAGTKNVNGKVVPWEESLRVPYAAAGGMVKKGLKLDAPVASVDLTATWLDLAGVKPAYPLAGRSLKSYLTSGKGTFQHAFSVWDDGRLGALAVNIAIEPYRVVRGREHKLIVWESKKQSLYNWKKDPGEERDLVDDTASAGVAKKLREVLRARLIATSDRALAWLG